MSALLALAGTQALGGLVQGVSSIFQGAKARRMAKANVRPTMTVPDEIQKITNDAMIRSKRGLSPVAYGNALNNILRNENSAIKTLRGRRSALLGVGAINRQANDSTTNLDVADDRQRDQNLRYYDQQRLNLANWKQKAWDWNERQRFMENADAIRALRGASQRNANGAVNNIMGAATTYFTGMQNRKDGLPTMGLAYPGYGGYGRYGGYGYPSYQGGMNIPQGDGDYEDNRS